MLKWLQFRADLEEEMGISVRSPLSSRGLPADRAALQLPPGLCEGPAPALALPGQTDEKISTGWAISHTIQDLISASEAQAGKKCMAPAARRTMHKGKNTSGKCELSRRPGEPCTKAKTRREKVNYPGGPDGSYAKYNGSYAKYNGSYAKYKNQKYIIT